MARRKPDLDYHAKGGHARAAALSPEQRRAQASAAARARWAAPGRPPTPRRPPRKKIPKDVKIAALLVRLGLDPSLPVEWDHSPPLAMRALNASCTDYDPPQLDPAHLYPMQQAAHRAKTSGRKGASRHASTADGDASKIAKAKRLERKRLIAAEREPREPPKGRRKLQSRPFPKRAK